MALRFLGIVYRKITPTPIQNYFTWCYSAVKPLPYRPGLDDEDDQMPDIKIRDVLKIFVKTSKDYARSWTSEGMEELRLREMKMRGETEDSNSLEITKEQIQSAKTHSLGIMMLFKDSIKEIVTGYNEGRETETKKIEQEAVAEQKIARAASKREKMASRANLLRSNTVKENGPVPDQPKDGL